jgi:hypothetical protein
MPAERTTRARDGVDGSNGRPRHRRRRIVGWTITAIVLIVLVGAAIFAIKAVSVVRDVAGFEGTRTYMIVFQNNAEIRSGGGLPAATAVVTVKDGKPKLAEQTSTYSFRRDVKVIDPPQQTQALYDDETFSRFGNFTRTPNFPTTAKAFDALWKLTTGERLDGVIIVDPVVLSHVLEATGPVTASDGTRLTSDNVVKAVLYDAYHRYSGSQQDEFFGDVASRVFAKLASGDWNKLSMFTQLQKSVSEQRLHVWFQRDSEQSIAAWLGLDGALPTSNEKSTEVGIFLNDYAASKLEYFLSSKVAVTCNAAKRTMTTSVTVKNDVPMDGMTNYQLGIRNYRYGIPRQTFILDVMYFAPPGSKITGVSPEAGDPSATRTGAERGRDVQSTRYFVDSGDTKTFSYTSTIPSGKRGPLAVRYSPTVTDTPVTISNTCDGLF